MKYWTKFFRLVLTLKLVENMKKINFNEEPIKLGGRPCGTPFQTS